jgi:hypothetical protein
MLFIIASPGESKVFCDYVFSAELILPVYRNCLREYCGLVDQEALEGSTISHQVIYQA